MSTKPNTAKIGVFVILAVILLIAGLLAFGAKSYFVKKTKFETAIPGEVYGLAVGSDVQLRGVPIGKVSQITFAWTLYPQTKTNFIVVEFETEGALLPLAPGLDMKMAVRQSVDRGLRAMVKSQGITGTSILALDLLDPKNYPPPDIDYTPRHFYIPSAPPQLTRVLESIEGSLHRLQELNFGAITHGVTNTLEDVRKVLVKLGEFDVAGLSSNANTLLVDVKGTNVKLTETIDEIQKTIKGMKLDSVGTNATGLITDVRNTNMKLQSVLDKVGTVPMQQSVADLQQVLQTLNDVLAELKDYPSGFIFGKPPRQVEGVQP